MYSVFDALPFNDAIEKVGEARLLTARFKADPDERKVDLGAGVYKDESGRPWVFPVVRRVEASMAAERGIADQKTPGCEDFERQATAFLLGSESSAITNKQVTSVQTPGGTGGLRLAAQFCQSMLQLNTVYIPDPSWVNHRGIFKNAGFPKVKSYRYWDTAQQCVDMRALLEDLNAADRRSAVVFHGCAHNPSGSDPSLGDWCQIADTCQRRDLFVIIDIAYQGFASGDPDVDALSVRRMVDKGVEMMVAQSFSKNFGLYNERVGNLCVVTSDVHPSSVGAVRSHLVRLRREMGLTPSYHGAAIVTRILQDPDLYTEWRSNLETAVKRLIAMRRRLYQGLVDEKTPGGWGAMLGQRGLFTLTCLNVNQVNHLREKFHIYMMKTGRICLSGLTEDNVDYAAKAVSHVVKNVGEETKI